LINCLPRFASWVALKLSTMVRIHDRSICPRELEHCSLSTDTTMNSIPIKHEHWE